MRYRSTRNAREPLRARIREIAGARVSYGYRQVHTLLRREGWPANHKLVYRLYREEGLTLRRRRPKRRRATVQRERPSAPSGPNERWAMDFMHDTLSGGRTLRVLTVLDVHTRECIALKAGRSFKGEDVAGTLSEAGEPVPISWTRGRLNHAAEPVPISWTRGRLNHAALRVSSSRAWAGVR